MQLLNGAIRLICLFATHSFCGNFIWHLSDTTRFAFDINCISLSPPFPLLFPCTAVAVAAAFEFAFEFEFAFAFKCIYSQDTGAEMDGGKRGERGKWVELCKVIYQANISNKLVKYYVIKLSAHAQQQSDTQAAESVELGAGERGRGWPGLAYVSQCQHKFHSTFDMTTIKSSGQPKRIRFHSHSHAHSHSYSH